MKLCLEAARLNSRVSKLGCAVSGRDAANPQTAHSTLLGHLVCCGVDEGLASARISHRHRIHLAARIR